MMKWIDPIERLPKSEEYVLITIKAGTLTSTGECGDNETIPAFFVDDSKYNSLVDGLWYPHFYEYGTSHIFNNRDIIAWMPFPAPYAKEAANA